MQARHVHIRQHTEAVQGLVLASCKSADSALFARRSPARSYSCSRRLVTALVRGREASFGERGDGTSTLSSVEDNSMRRSCSGKVSNTPSWYRLMGLPGRPFSGRRRHIAA